MMAEPTLGARIMEAADHLADRTMDCDDGGIADANDQLRALCARADAAEQLAVAADAYSAACLLFDESDHPDVSAHYRESTDKYDNALAAWRAINGEVA